MAKKRTPGLGEIKDFRFGGKGARGYACLMTKEGRF
jgi:hypothetical protein